MKQLDWPGVKQATWLQAGLSKPQSEGRWMGEGRQGDWSATFCCSGLWLKYEGSDVGTSPACCPGADPGPWQAQAEHLCR